MFISDFVNQFSSNQTVTGKVPKGSAEARTASNAARTEASLARLAKGSTFEGNVSDIKGDRVTLSLENGKTVTARLADNVPITKGESLFFEVKSNDGNTVNIRPISAGLVNNPIIAAALDSAGLAITEKNASLVDVLMKEQLPIDAKSLGTMLRASSMYPEAGVDNLATMQKAGIPINDEMVQQFTNYKTSEGGIIDGLSTIADAITDTFAAENVEVADIIQFNENLTSILTTEEGVVPHLFDGDGNVMVQPDNAEIIQVEVTEDGKLAASEETQVIELEQIEDAPETLNSKQSVETVSDKMPETAQQTESKAVIDTNQVVESGKTAEAEQIAGSEQTDKSEQSLDTKQTVQSDQTSVPELKQSVETDSSNNSKTAVVLSDSARNELTSLLKDAGVEHPDLFDEKGNLRSDITSSKIIETVSEHFKDNPDILKQDILKLLSSDSYKTVLKDAMMRRWTMEPSDVADKAKVKDFYAKLSVDMERLGRVAAEMSKGENPISNASSSVQSNVDFINQVNQIYSYVQLPLKLSGQEATGDLYVFSNKKGKRSPDDELSAFLHFDLANLGSTDISVKMKKKNVSTDFYLDDDVSFTLIEKNLPILESKLNKLGYNVKASVKNEKKSVDFVDDFIKQEAPVSGGVRRYSFDVTA